MRVQFFSLTDGEACGCRFHGSLKVPLRPFVRWGVLLANGGLGRSSREAGRRALRTLVRTGCGPDELALIVSRIEAESPDESVRSDRLREIAAFVSAIGRRAARDFFRAIRESGAVDRLLAPDVLEFGRSVDAHTAEWYFWALWGTRSVAELTEPSFLRDVDFFRSVGEPAVVEYFVAMRETRAVRELTDPRVREMARSIGPDAAVEYFGSLWETKCVDELTGRTVLDFARSLGGETAKEYFLAIRETRDVASLTDLRVLLFAEREGPRIAEEYFRAIRETRAAQPLTGEAVRLFAESIGKPSALAYFRAVGSTRAIRELTDGALLEMAGVVRSIGSDAALDYFLAAADRSSRPSGEAPAAGAPKSLADGGVPVLTLLDIPTYLGYRIASLAAVTACFWSSLFVAVPLGSGGDPVPLELVGAVAGWAALLTASFFLVGKMAERSGEEFLNRRRRLLNEHGIRWHDCGTTDRRCPLCWRADHTHADGRFDYQRFCRCPAC